MRISKTKKTSITVESVENIKCDVCSKKIIRKGVEEGHCSSLVYHKFIPGEEGGFIEKEISDFCPDCYFRIKDFIITIGGSVPSFYLNTDNSDVLNEETQDDKLH